MTERPKFPKKAPMVTVGPLTFELLHDFDRFRSGRMLMKFQDTLADFHGERSGVVFKGSVGAAIGGTIFVEINGRCWVLRPQALVDAVLAAEKPYLAQTPRLRRTKVSP